MQLGKIQKAWIDSLKSNPERQATGQLGKGEPSSYKACCLGELHVIGCKLLGKPAPFNNNYICDYDPSYPAGILHQVYLDYGLHNAAGTTLSPFSIEGRKFKSLVEANDRFGITWPQIAEAIEKDPANFFNKSV